MFNIFVVFATVSHFYLARSQYYVGVKGAKTWEQAQSACQSGVSITASGGQLATWNTFDQYKNEVVPAAATVGLNAWVGISDLSVEGHWLFVDNNPPGDQDKNPAWSNNQPDNYVGAQDCAYVWQWPSRTDGNVKGLDDGGCGAGLNFVCEFTTLKGDTVNGPSLEFPNDDGAGNKNNYFIFEFSSGKDMVILASIMLNVVLMAAVCGLVSKRACGFNSGGSYSKVNMYSTDAEDEKLNI